MSHLQYTSDTSREAYQVQLALLRRMSPHERLNNAFALTREVRRMSMDAIRRRHPEFDENAVQLKFIELTYGVHLAEEVGRLLDAQRPRSSNGGQEDGAIE